MTKYDVKEYSRMTADEATKTNQLISKIELTNSFWQAQVHPTAIGAKALVWYVRDSLYSAATGDKLSRGDQLLIEYLKSISGTQNGIKDTGSLLNAISSVLTPQVTQNSYLSDQIIDPLTPTAEVVLTTLRIENEPDPFPVLELRYLNEVDGPHPIGRVPLLSTGFSYGSTRAPFQEVNGFEEAAEIIEKQKFVLLTCGRQVDLKPKWLKLAINIVLPARIEI